MIYLLTVLIVSCCCVVRPGESRGWST